MTTPIRADRLVREPVDWLWNERIPRGMFTLVAGLPGQGKSLFGYYLAAETSRTAGVIYSTWEESLRKTALARLEAAGAQLERVHLWTPELPEETERLHKRIVEFEAELVVLDPIAAHLGVSIFNDQDVRRALSPLKVVAEETDAAIVAISHTVKRVTPGAHPMDAIGGSGGGLRAAARMAYLFGRNFEDADEVLLACVKSNVAAEPASYAFELDVHDFADGDEAPFLVPLGERGESLADARIMLDSTRKQEKPDVKRAAASEFLVNYLRFGPRPVRELKEDAIQYGHSWATIRRAADELGIVKPRGGPNATWALPAELLAELDAEDGSE